MVVFVEYEGADAVMLFLKLIVRGNALTNISSDAVLNPRCRQPLLHNFLACLICCIRCIL